MADLSDIVQKIGHEINPENDMERFTYARYSDWDENSDFAQVKKEQLKQLLNNMSHVLWLWKPALRGAAVGSLAGGLASAMSGHDLAEGVRYGANYGAILDAGVFMLRDIYYAMKAQIE